MVVAALQETKWFGSKVWDSVVLTSGREVPIGSGVRQRGEGVAIVLAGPAVHAWKAGGCKWKAWSSRLVTATYPAHPQPDQSSSHPQRSPR